jgi:hypothetical protein
MDSTLKVPMNFFTWGQKQIWFPKCCIICKHEMMGKVLKPGTNFISSISWKVRNKQIWAKKIKKQVINWKFQKQLEWNMSDLRFSQQWLWRMRLLGYESPVCTSEETHYVSATEPTHLMLCKILGLHGSDYEGCRILGCYAMWLL